MEVISIKNLFIKNKDNIEFNVIKIPKTYEVDFEKVNSIAMLKVLIKVLFKGLNVTIQEDSAYYEELKSVLKETK